MTEPHPLEIPACLLLTAEQRREGWKRHGVLKPVPVAAAVAPIKGKPRERRVSESNPRSKTPKDTKGMRWDLRKSRWVPDVPFAPPKRDPRRPDALWRTGGAMEAQREHARATVSYGEVQKPERPSKTRSAKQDL